MARRDDTRRRYKKAGIGRRVGFGKRPALIIVDFLTGFTDPSMPLGARMDAEIEATRQLLVLARQRELPIVYAVLAYEEGCRDGGLYVHKIPTLKSFLLGSSLVQIDRRLEPLPGEHVITKKFMSAFFGTNLVALLSSERVDTVIITGCVTSACIRATATDAMQYGFHTILPRECVADRAEGPHEANLFDIDAKIGDVVSLSEVVDYLKSVPVVEPAS